MAIRAAPFGMRKVDLCRAAYFWSGAELCRLRLGDGPKLSLVLYYVGPVHFCRRSRQLNVVTPCS